MKKCWEYKKLGDVGSFTRGGNFSKKDFVDNGFPCIHYGQIHMKFGIETFKHISSVPTEIVKSERCAKKGDLIIAITSEDDAGSCKCTTWMGDYDVYVGGHTAIYRHTMQPKYVSYYFMSPSFQKDKLEYTHGFKVVEINPKDIAKITIPVPPLPEQQRIVAYLDAAFAKIDAMKANAENALKEAKALFQASLKEMMQPKPGWEEKKMSSLYDVRDGTHDSPKYHETGYPLVTSKNLKGGILDMKNVNLISESDYKSINSRSKVDIGDVLFAMIGTIGNPVYVKDEPNYAIKNMALFKVSAEQSGEFLRYYLLNDSILLKIQNEAKGTTQKFVSLGYLRNFLISIPPLSEQQSIVAALDAIKSRVDRLQSNFDTISRECDALKQAILREVFEGE